MCGTAPHAIARDATKGGGEARKGSHRAGDPGSAPGVEAPEWELRDAAGIVSGVGWEF